MIYVFIAQIVKKKDKYYFIILNFLNSNFLKNKYQNLIIFLNFLNINKNFKQV